jgi:hypothetical protein
LPLEIYTRCIGSDFATWSPKTHLEELSGLAFDWHDLDGKWGQCAKLDKKDPSQA